MTTQDWKKLTIEVRNENGQCLTGVTVLVETYDGPWTAEALEQLATIVREYGVGQ